MITLSYNYCAIALSKFVLDKIHIKYIFSAVNPTLAEYLQIRFVNSCAISVGMLKWSGKFLSFHETVNFGMFH